ncbi:MAG: hypothetical protein KBA51_05175 [Kiritimatiellae bacterium]|nr:hypothetical protein [Kiritimatiellia bacterium]
MRYGRTWGLAFGLFVLLLAGAELFFRHQGHVPSVTDDKVLWAHERSRLYPSDGRRAIALLGASRLQLGVVPNVLARELPGTRPVCLAVDGHSPFSFLEDLAADEKFRGIVVYEATPPVMATPEVDAWLSYYHGEYLTAASADERVSMAIRVFLQKRLVITTFWVNIRRQIGYLFQIPLDHVVTREDRSRQGWYDTRMSASERLRRRSGRLIPPDKAIPSAAFSSQQFEETVFSKIAPLVKRLREHGAEIVFLHMPMPDRHPDVACYPRALYWDRIAPLTGATTIHPDDYPSLRGFQCPDGSHLNADDAVRFTVSLAELLKTLVEDSR